MSIELIERVSQILGVAVVVLAILTALAGAGSWYFSSKVTAAAHLDLEQLKEKQRARVITEDQKKSFQKFMEGKHKGPVRVMSISTNNEVKDFVNQIKAMLAANGCGLPAGSPARIVMGDISTSNHEGTMLLVRSEKSAPAYAGDVQKAFESAGISMSAIEVPNEQNVVLEGEVVVFVTERR